jgi:hypothetical protein
MSARDGGEGVGGVGASATGPPTVHLAHNSATRSQMLGENC